MDVSESEKKSINHILPSLKDSITLCNDYWSWRKEFADAGGRQNQVMNAVSILLRSANVDEPKALEMLKQRTIEMEGKFLRLYNDFISSSSPSPSPDLRRYLDGHLWIVSGCNFWSATCPRYHCIDFDKIETEPQPVLS